MQGPEKRHRPVGMLSVMLTCPCHNVSSPEPTTLSQDLRNRWRTTLVNHIFPIASISRHRKEYRNVLSPQYSLNHNAITGSFHSYSWKIQSCDKNGKSSYTSMVPKLERMDASCSPLGINQPHFEYLSLCSLRKHDFSGFQLSLFNFISEAKRRRNVQSCPVY